jgi:predicted amidohydrolase YtcJ
MSIVISVLVLAVLAVVVYFISRPRTVSALLYNGVVYTMNAQAPQVQALAIDRGQIVAIGSSKELLAAFRSNETVDLGGRAVYPGFIDSHAHLENIGAALMNLDLTGTTSLEEIRTLVGKEAARKGPGAWVRGRGWDQNKWASKAFPTHNDLDDVTGGVPVYLVRVDGHAVWLNRKAMSLVGVDRNTPDTGGGAIIRDKSGDPTGIFVDNAIEIVTRGVPPPTADERREAILRGVHECIRYGLTEVHDMGVDLEGIHIYKKLLDAGQFPFRVYVAVGGTGDAWASYLKSGPEIGLYDGRLTVRALKLYADGALGSRGAALIEPYTDDPTNRGLTVTTAAELKSAAVAAFDRGFQVCIHAIGDRANAIVLGVYEDVFKSKHTDGSNVRFRIEHAQVLDTADIKRFHRDNVIPVMQATHCTSDMPWAEDRLGPSRILGAYAWRSLLNCGSIVPGGSDAPVESPNPLWGFYAAITRQDRSGHPPGGWRPEQRMTREEALKSYTVWAAYAGFQENVKGALEQGKWADLVVLSDDVMKIDPAKILDVTVDLTVIGGVVVYSSGAIPGVSGPAAGGSPL